MTQATEENKATPQEETDGDILAEQAYAEMDAAKKKQAGEEEEPVEKEQLQIDAAEPSDKQEEPSKQAEEKPAEKTEKEKPAEQAEKPKEEAKKEQPAAPSKTEEEIVVEYAAEHNLTISEAREDMKATEAVMSKYQKDPLKMAKALRQIQSQHDKLRSEVEKQEKPQIIQREPADEIRQYVEENAEQIVKSYRRAYPNKSELMSDEAILEEAMHDAMRDFRAYEKDNSVKMKQKAAEIREKVTAGLSSLDKRVQADVRAVLSRTPDNILLAKDFDHNEIVLWAKGQYYDADIKAAEERGYKRGKEEAVIMGVVPTASKSTTKAPPATTSLNNAQKQRAVEMFPLEDGYTEDQAYAMYKDTYKDFLKKDPNFI